MSTLLEYYRSGGPIMHAILFVAVLGLAVLFERLWIVVIKGRGHSRQFINDILLLVKSGRTAQALEKCQSAEGAVADIGVAVLEHPSRDEGVLQGVADGAAMAALPVLTRRLHYLPMLANVATLLGLLGTIFGLREAFASVAMAAAAERSARLASGIAIALNATGFGLLVAVPLSVAHAWLVSQSDAAMERVDEFCVRIAGALAAGNSRHDS